MYVLTSFHSCKPIVIAIDDSIVALTSFIVITNHRNLFSTYTVNISESMDDYFCINYFPLDTNTLSFHFDRVSKLLLFIYAGMITQLEILVSNKWMCYSTGILCNGINISGLYVVALDLDDNYVQIYVHVGVKLFILAVIINVLRTIIIALVIVWLINTNIQLELRKTEFKTINKLKHCNMAEAYYDRLGD